MIDQIIFQEQEQLQVEINISNRDYVDVPKEIKELPLHELRTHLLSASQAFVTLIGHNKNLREKLQKVAVEVQDSKKYEEELLQKQNQQLLRQRELQELQNQKLKEQKYDQIILKQESVIQSLQEKMEKVILQKLSIDKDDEELEILNGEIKTLTENINDAQYGLINDEGLTGEDREIDRIEQESIPQLQQLLDNLNTQLEEQLKNPIVQYGTRNPKKFDTKRQQLYYDEYFANDHPDGIHDENIQGNWRVQKSEMEAQLELERFKYDRFQLQYDQNELEFDSQLRGLKLVGQKKGQAVKIGQNY